jgi:hypothetical protein
LTIFSKRSKTGWVLFVVRRQVRGDILQAEEDRVADQVPAVERGHDARLFGLPLGRALAVAAAVVAGRARLLRDDRIHPPVTAGKLHIVLPSQVFGLEALGRQPKQERTDVAGLAADQGAGHGNYLAA